MRKYTLEVINHINLFENLTGARVKDCFTDDRGKYIFIIEEGDLGKAIGKNAVNVKRIEKIFKKKIRVIGFSKNIVKFIKNFIYPIEVDNIEQKDDTIEIKASGVQTKGLLIGRDSRNLNMLKSAVKKYFDISNISVV